MDKWLNNNTFVRITALILGVLLWAVVHFDEQASTTTQTSLNQTRSVSDVQITVVGLDEDQYYLKSIDPSVVHIVLRGRESAINLVSTKNGQSQIQLDLSGITEGEHVLPLKSVGFPSGVTVDIYPSRVNVVIEAIRSKEVPVVVELVGEPAQGYKAGVPINNPNRVHVRVPESQLEQITAARATVDISGAQSAVVVKEKLVAIDSSGNVVEATINPAVVNVEVPITSPFKTVPLRIELLNEPAEGFSVARVRPSVNEITIYGPEDVLEGYDFYDGLQIDVAHLTRSRTFTLDIPLHDRIHQVFPTQVEVEVEIVPAAERTISQLPIRIVGANENYNTTILSPPSGTVDIRVQGAPSVLNNLRDEDVQAIVDVSNVPEGVHDLPVKLNIPENVIYSGDKDIIVKVEIKANAEETGGEPDERVSDESISHGYNG